MVTARAAGDSGARRQAGHQQGKEMAAMHQLTQLLMEETSAVIALIKAAAT